MARSTLENLSRSLRLSFQRFVFSDIRLSHSQTHPKADQSFGRWLVRRRDVLLMFFRMFKTCVLGGSGVPVDFLSISPRIYLIT